MRAAIAGFEKSGKTTLFNAITGLNIEVSGGQTPENLIHEGIAVVLDPRIDLLTKMFKPKKTTFATIEYLDMPGLGKNTPQRNQKILDSLKDVDLIINVVRAFDDPASVHPLGGIDVQRDIKNFESEILLVDHLLIEKRIERMEQNMKRGLKENPAELETFKTVKDHIEQELPLRSFTFTEEHKRVLAPYKFVSSLPVIHVINLGENTDIVSRPVGTGQGSDKANCGTALIRLCGKIEKEISELAPEDRSDFLKELGIEEPASNRLVRESYRLLGLIAFFTVGEDEVRAWTIRDGMTAKEAGGRIHSDIEKGFIRAEVVSYQDYIDFGDFKKVKEKGLLRLEGKTYIVKDGDIINFRFNV